MLCFYLINIYLIFSILYMLYRSVMARQTLSLDEVEIDRGSMVYLFTPMPHPPPPLRLRPPLPRVTPPLSLLVHICRSLLSYQTLGIIT